MKRQESYPWESDESALRTLFNCASGINVHAIGFDSKSMGYKTPLSRLGKSWWVVRENSCGSLGCDSFASLRREFTEEERTYFPAQNGLFGDYEELWFLVVASSENEARIALYERLPFLKTHWPPRASAEMRHLNKVLDAILDIRLHGAFK